MKLSTKIGLALFLVLASALSMTTALNYLRFDQTLHTLLAQRMTVILNETSQDILAGIDLGLRLENMENLQPILNRRLDMSNDIRNFAVLDCDGTIISNADRSPDSSPDDQALSGAAIDQQVRDQWIDFTPGIATAGQVLRDSLGQCAGQVVITASAETSEAKLANSFSEMWKSAALGMGMSVSLSHSDRFAVALVFHRAHPLGIDVDLPVMKDVPAILDGIAPDIRTMIRAHDLDDHGAACLLWVARESLAKTITTGMMTPLELYAPSSIERNRGCFEVRYANFGQYRTIIWPGVQGWLGLTLPDQTRFDPASLPWD